MNVNYPAYLFEALRAALSVFIGYIYALGIGESNLVFKIAMIVFFIYLISYWVEMILFRLYLFFKTPEVLPEVPFENIPSEQRTAVLYTVRAKTLGESEYALARMEETILGNLTENVIFVFGSNGCQDNKIIEYEKQSVEKLQAKYGRDKVYYFLLNPAVHYGKKWGFYQDVMVFLYEGKEKPAYYLGNYRGRPIRRESGSNLFSCILGDIGSLCIGMQGGRIENILIMDADSVIQCDGIRKIIRKAAHPTNSNYMIFQPRIKIAHGCGNLFQQFSSFSSDSATFYHAAYWFIYKKTPYYGKAVIKIGPYLERTIKTELLSPDARSHDITEGAHIPTAYLLDVYLWEDSYSNFIVELTRGDGWRIGDLQALKRDFFKMLDLPSRKRLSLVARTAFGEIIFLSWLIGGVYESSYVETSPENLFYKNICFYIVILIILIIVFNALFQYVTVFNKDSELGLSQRLSVPLVGTLLYLQNLIYSPIHTCKAVYTLMVGGRVKWDTLFQLEAKGGQLGIVNAHLHLFPSFCAGMLLVWLIFKGHLPFYWGIWGLPMVSSFLFGPFVTWYTCNHNKLLGR